MISMNSMLKVADNSGAKIVTCIKVLGGSHHMAAKLSDVIIVAVRVASPNSKVAKKATHKAVIVRSRYGLNRKDGTKISFDDNAVVILNDQLEPIGTRVLGPVPRELKGKFDKICSLSDRVI